jgi:hypothetical protein
VGSAKIVRTQVPAQGCVAEENRRMPLRCQFEGSRAGSLPRRSRRREAYLAWTLAVALPLAASSSDSAPGQHANLAEFGVVKVWRAQEDGERVSTHGGRGWLIPDSHSGIGVEWDEPREFKRIEAEFASAVKVDAVRLQYWVSTWPQVEGRGGWTATDSAWRGEWRDLRTDTVADGSRLAFTFLPLAEQENPNAKNRPGFAPTSRRALKIRIVASAAATLPPLLGIRVYGDTVWSRRRISVEGGCEGAPRHDLRFEVYNGSLLEVSARDAVSHLDIAYLEHAPESGDRTLLGVQSGSHRFSVAVDDLALHKNIYVQTAGLFFSDGNGTQFKEWSSNGHLRPGQGIRSRVSARPEQSLERATAEIPALSTTANNGRHPHRYVPLGITGVREKFALEFNGNLFISKHGSKLFADELARMRWEGDKIRFHLGTGAIPDFRERERSAQQRLQADEIPIVSTNWETDGVQYRQEAFATLITGFADPWSLTGGESAVAMIEATATNPGTGPQKAYVWLHIAPEEALSLDDGALHGGTDRYRLLVEQDSGTVAVRRLPAAASIHGNALLWTADLKPGEKASVRLRIPFRTFSTAAEIAAARSLDYTGERGKVEQYWQSELARGMQVHVPDEPLNRLFRASLQHMLVSVQRDVPTGLYLLPCGTYDYNMYLNETNMQVRLLDMRGLHGLARRFLEPMLAFQGSKAFPGKYTTSTGIFHGIRMAPDRDYTHWGYNLNHGWTMWTLAEHFRFTGDREWLRSIRQNLLSAAKWIVEERKATQRREADGTPAREFGLLPAGQLEDNEEWHHWFAVNAYAYRGLRAAGEVLATLDPAEGANLQREAERYRADIRRAVERAVADVPVARLRSGAWGIVVPPRTRLHGRDTGWIRNILYGAHVLLDCGVFEVGEPVAEYILDDLEDNLFLGTDAFSVAEQDWFSRGGIAMQPSLVNTFTTYASRGETPQALRAFYNTFAASYYPDINAFTEWLPSFGRGGGPYYKTSDEAAFLAWLRLMLIREEGRNLNLTPTAPRRWFRPGGTIEVRNAQTFFGTVSFTITSEADRDRIVASLILPTPREPGGVVAVRLRHPDGKRLISATVNDGEALIDTASESVQVPFQSGTFRIVARFEGNIQ